MQSPATHPTDFTPQADAALPLRDHTILGVCEAIGEDFGFNPLLLRVPLAASVLWNPYVAIAGYLALGVVVLLSRLVFPKPTVAVEAPAGTANQPEPVEPRDISEDERLPIAA
jgi:phage shock protein C